VHQKISHSLAFRPSNSLGFLLKARGVGIQYLCHCFAVGFKCPTLVYHAQLLRPLASLGGSRFSLKCAANPSRIECDAITAQTAPNDLRLAVIYTRADETSRPVTTLDRGAVVLGADGRVDEDATRQARLS
jgi:hypothetical protein